MPATDIRWMDEASCRHRPDLDWFDIDCNLEACLTVCQTCPVANECLDYAITHELRDGVWGGEWGYRLARYVRTGGRGPTITKRNNGGRG